MIWWSAPPRTVSSAHSPATPSLPTATTCCCRTARAELGAAARRDNPAAVTQVALEFIDDTLGFNPEWVVDRIAPRPILFITTDDDRLVPPQESEAMYARAGEPKKLVVLKGFGHYEVYSGDAFRQVMEETLAWYGTHLPAR